MSDMYFSHVSFLLLDFFWEEHAIFLEAINVIISYRNALPATIKTRAIQTLSGMSIVRINNARNADSVPCQISPFGVTNLTCM